MKETAIKFKGSEKLSLISAESTIYNLHLYESWAFTRGMLNSGIGICSSFGAKKILCEISFLDRKREQKYNYKT